MLHNETIDVVRHLFLVKKVKYEEMIYAGRVTLWKLLNLRIKSVMSDVYNNLGKYMPLMI